MTTNVPEPDDVISGSGPEHELPHVSDRRDAPERGHHTASPTAGTETGTESDAVGPLGVAEIAAELSGYLDEVDQVVRERLTDEVLDARLAQIFHDSERPDDTSGDDGGDDDATGNDAAGTAPEWPTAPARPGAPVQSGAPPFRLNNVSILLPSQRPQVPKPSMKKSMRTGSGSWREILAAGLAERPIGDSLRQCIDAHRDAQSVLTMARLRAEQQEDAALSIAASTVRQARREAELILLDARQEAAQIVEGARTAALLIDGAHRTCGAEMLREWLRHRPERPWVLELSTGIGKTSYFVAAAREWTEQPTLRLGRLLSSSLLAAELCWDLLGEEAVPPILLRHPLGIFGTGKILPVQGGLTTGLHSDVQSGLTSGTVLSSVPCGGGGLPAVVGSWLEYDHPVAGPEKDPPRAVPGSFWASLTAVEQERFAAVAITVRFAPDAVLMHEGDMADHALVIQSGLVRVVRRRAAEVERLIAMRGPGDVIGERAYLATQGRSATVTAATTVTALKISADDLRTFLDQTPGVHAWLERLMFDRMVDEFTQDGSSESAPGPASSSHVQVEASAGVVEDVHEPGTTPQRRLVHMGKWVRAGVTEGVEDTASSGGSTSYRGATAMPGRRPTMSPSPRRATILAVDVAPWTKRPVNASRSKLYEIMREACAAADLQWDDCYRQDRGDGVLLILPPSVYLEDIAENLAGRLAAVLHRHNQSVSPISRIRLRMAVHTGHLHSDDNSSDDHRFSERTLFRSALMARAPLFKRAMEEAGTDLGLILSDQAYGHAISQGGLSDPTRYIPVGIALPASPPAADRTTAGGWWSRSSPFGGNSLPTASRSQAPAATVSEPVPPEPSGFRRPWADRPVPSSDACMPTPVPAAQLEHLTAAGGVAESAHLGGSAPPRTAASITTRAWTWFPAGRELARG